MDNLQTILSYLKQLGCSGIKISFEDEGAQYNEIITMRNLTTSIGLDLSIKIGGCEAKRDIIDCIDLNCDAIVAPMVETKFALHKFLKSLETYKCNKVKGFNLETIQAYNNLDELATHFNMIDFVTLGRVDFVGSLNKDRTYVESDDIYDIAVDIFKMARAHNILCYLGGAISISSKDFIHKLINAKLIDKFETRYIIFDIHRINFEYFEDLIYWGNVFEVEWLKFIHSRYLMHANKDITRIKMIEERISCNKRLRID